MLVKVLRKAKEKIAATSFESGYMLAMRLTAILLSVFLLRILGQRMEAKDYSVYLIIRNIVGWLIAINMVGMSTAIPRTIAVKGVDGSMRAETVMVAGFIIALPILLLQIGLSKFFSDTLAYIIFMDETFAYVVPSLFLLASASTAFLIVSAYFSGLSIFWLVLTIEPFYVGIIPISLCCFFEMPLRIEWFINSVSLCTVLVAGVALSCVLFKRGLGGFEKKRIIAAWKELFRYGIPKMISGISQMSFVGLFPVSLHWGGASHNQSAAATLGFGMASTLARLVTTTSALIYFNKMAVYHITDKDKYRSMLEDLLRVSIGVGALLCVMGFLMGDIGIKILIGRMFECLGLYVNAGALFGFVFFGITCLEIPIDGIAPPWYKAVGGLIILCVALSIIGLMALLKSTSLYLIFGVFFISQIIYFVMLIRITWVSGMNMRASDFVFMIPCLALLVAFAAFRFLADSFMLHLFAAVVVLCGIFYLLWSEGIVSILMAKQTYIEEKGT